MTTAIQKFSLALLIICILWACNGDEEKDKAANPVIPVADSSESLASIAKEDSALLFDRDPSNLFGSEMKVPLNWQTVELMDFWVEDSLPTEKLLHSPEFFKDYAPVLKWSPDSGHILDLGSYGKAIITDASGKKAIADGDIDSRISVIDPKNKKKEELMFFGSDTQFIDGGWLNNHQVAILAAKLPADNVRSDTLMWLIDLDENFFRKYKLH